MRGRQAFMKAIRIHRRAAPRCCSSTRSRRPSRRPGAGARRDRRDRRQLHRRVLPDRALQGAAAAGRRAGRRRHGTGGRRRVTRGRRRRPRRLGRRAGRVRRDGRRPGDAAREAPRRAVVPRRRGRHAAGHDRALPRVLDLSARSPATRASCTPPRAASGSCSARSRSAAAPRCIATVSTEEKAALARAAGADTSSSTRRRTSRRRPAGDRRAGVHVVYDGVGATTFEKGLDCLRPRGMMVLFGAVERSRPAFRSRAARTPRARSSSPARALPLHHGRATSCSRARATSSAGSASGVRSCGSPSVPLAEAAAAHRMLEARKTDGKVLLVP